MQLCFHRMQNMC